jgi:hypothetical protein
MWSIRITQPPHLTPGSCPNHGKLIQADRKGGYTQTSHYVYQADTKHFFLENPYTEVKRLPFYGEGIVTDGVILILRQMLKTGRRLAHSIQGHCTVLGLCRKVYGSKRTSRELAQSAGRRLSASHEDVLSILLRKSYEKNFPTDDNDGACRESDGSGKGMAVYLGSRPVEFFI